MDLQALKSMTRPQNAACATVSSKTVLWDSLTSMLEQPQSANKLSKFSVVVRRCGSYTKENCRAIRNHRYWNDTDRNDMICTCVNESVGTTRHWTTFSDSILGSRTASISEEYWHQARADAVRICRVGFVQKIPKVGFLQILIGYSYRIVVIKLPFQGILNFGTNQVCCSLAEQTNEISPPNFGQREVKVFVTLWDGVISWCMQISSKGLGQGCHMMPRIAHFYKQKRHKTTFLEETRLIKQRRPSEGKQTNGQAKCWAGPIVCVLQIAISFVLCHLKPML